MVMLSVSQGQSRTTSDGSTSPRAISRFSSARARRTRLARSSALICCGASTVDAMVVAGAIEAASTGLLPSRNRLTGYLAVRPEPLAGGRGPVGQSFQFVPNSRPGRSARRPSYVVGVAGRQPAAAPNVGPARSLRATISAAETVLSDPPKAETTPDGGCQESVTRRVRCAGRSGKSSITLAIVPRAPSRCSRSWVAIRLVRSSAPPGGTAGWIATLV